MPATDHPATVTAAGTPTHPCRCTGTCTCPCADAGRHWQDWGYTTGRSKPVGVVHCQAHHDRIVAFRQPGAYRPGYSVKLPPSDKRNCFTCGK
jgi:hypothetical protein